MIVGHGLLGFRDPHGIRPLVIGRRETPQGIEYMLASESVALDSSASSCCATSARARRCSSTSTAGFYSQQCVPVARHTPCIFEYVYFARPDSIIDNISVHKARLRMGDLLAEKIRRDLAGPRHRRGDPDSGHQPHRGACRSRSCSASSTAKASSRTATSAAPSSCRGRSSARNRCARKLNVIDLEFRGKNVLLIDDSIVRGTTSAQIIDLAREAGARSVYFASAAPPVRFPNVYGIDMPAASELVAAGRTEEEVAKLIGADRLIYQDLDDLVRACLHHDSQIQEFDDFLLLGPLRHRRRHARLPGAPAGRALRRRRRHAAASNRGSLKAIRAV